MSHPMAWESRSPQFLVRSLSMSGNLFRKLFRPGSHPRTKKAGRPRRARPAIETLEERVLLDVSLGVGLPRALLDNPAAGSVIGTPTHAAASGHRPHALGASQAARSRAKAGAASIVATAVNATTVVVRFKQPLGPGAANPAS